MPDNNSLVPRQTVLPPDGRELRMPRGTPLGIGFLGAARFAAIRRVLEHAERATRATAALIDARSEVNNALVRHAVSLEQLNNLDTIRDDISTRIVEGAEINKLRLRLERMELEDQIAAKELARVKARGTTDPLPAVPKPVERQAPKPDEYANFIRDLQRMPEIAKAAANVKEQIIRDAGGEQSLSGASLQMVEMIDVLTSAFMQKKAEDKIL